MSKYRIVSGFDLFHAKAQRKTAKPQRIYTRAFAISLRLCVKPGHCQIQQVL